MGSFQKACVQGASKGVIVWEWVNRFQLKLPLFNSLTNDMILDFSELEAFADDKINAS